MIAEAHRLLHRVELLGEEVVGADFKFDVLQSFQECVVYPTCRNNIVFLGSA